ncbi:MAG: TonB-dependent receptor [Acidobacteria bacterium]|nr:TonB-dependent receptor [Acidobacteriota bacterium]
MTSPIGKLIAAIAVCGFGLAAQTSRGSLSGTISDPSGATVPGAGVELRSTETGVVRSTLSNDSGLYRFDAVDPGTYDVQVKAGGFRSFASKGLPMRAGVAATMDARLEVGDAQTIVEVSSAAAQLQVEAPVRGGNLDRTQLVQLPNATRNPVSLILTVPGVSTNRFANGRDTFSVNGSRGRSNNFLIDGTENNDISVAGQAFEVKIPDAVQEVNVQTSNYDAEFGRAAGAVVNVITRSGTNHFHGTVSYVLDSTVDDALTNTQSLVPELVRRGRPGAGTEQLWAATLGGPVKRDRTFFFLGFQEDRLQATSTTSVTTLTANGWATLDSLYPQGRNKQADLYRTMTSKLAATANPFSVGLGSGRPALEFGTAATEFGRSVPDRQWMARVDHRISDHDQISGRLMWNDRNNPNGATATFFPGFGTSALDRYRNALITETHVFSPAMTNELRLHYNRIFYDFPLDVAKPELGALPRVVLGSNAVTSLGTDPALPQGRKSDNYGIQDTATILRGSHTFRMGFDLLHQRSKQFAPITSRGALDYRDGGGFSYFANFLDDFGGSGPAGGSAVRDFGSPAYYPSLYRQAYFFQDRWKVNSSLTMTLGLRYENFGVPINNLRTPAFTGLFNVDPVNFTGPFDKPNSVKRDNNNFGPTAGLAWAPKFEHGPLAWVFGDRKAVFRAGYQVSFDTFFNNIASNASTSSPNAVSTQVTSTVNATTPRGLPNLSTALPLVSRPVTPLDTQNLVIGNLVNPYAQRFSAGIQREVAAGTIVDVSYVGSKGTRLFVNEELNPVVPSSLSIAPSTPTPIPATRLNSRYDALQGRRAIRTNGGSSIYHGLQTSANRRFSKGLQAGIAYTWSKALDNGSEIFVYNSAPSSSQIPAIFGGQKLERGLSLFDRTHRLSFNYYYELPFMKAQRGVPGRVIGGWAVSGFTAFETGVPLTVLNGVDADGWDGSGSDRPELNPAGRPGVRAKICTTSATGYCNPEAGNAAIDPKDARYIQRRAFAGTAPLPSGNAARNTERVPGIKNWNINLFKAVQVTERFRFEFRTEFYNAFNTPQYTTPSVSPFAPSAQGLVGNSVSATPDGRFLRPEFLDGGGRVIRYQLKLVF